MIMFETSTYGGTNMKDLENKINWEAIKGTTISEDVPAFDESRKGTEVFIMRGDKRISVYDDYSIYPESKARRWKVKVYNHKNGIHYDRICMCNGFYPTRERALAEVERFKYRGDSMIFFVLPIDFSFDMKKYVWSEDEHYGANGFIPATPEEQLEEARKRLYCMTGRKPKKIDLLKKYKNTFAEITIKAFYKTQKNKEIKAFPFVMLNTYIVSYVGPNKAEWWVERQGIDNKTGTLYDGYISAYVYNHSHPHYNEYGDVWYKYEYGHLYPVVW